MPPRFIYWDAPHDDSYAVIDTEKGTWYRQYANGSSSTVYTTAGLTWSPDYLVYSQLTLLLIGAL